MQFSGFQNFLGYCDNDEEMYSILQLLLMDRTTNKNIIWGTDDYSGLYDGYSCTDSIDIHYITGENCSVIKHRFEKSIVEQANRTKKKAEVFTPTWICNTQNNSIDNAWFGAENMFNYECEADKCWSTNPNKIIFPKDKNWMRYVEANRLEITCGEAPYLTSRYDMATGVAIAVRNRVGLLDRKFRVISENIDDRAEWIKWATSAVQSIYGYEFQGDSLLIARKNVLLTILEFYRDKFSDDLDFVQVVMFAYIISWNIWQMDGLKFVIPHSCDDTCKSCKTKKIVTNGHNGIRCYIMNWEDGAVEVYSDLLEG